MGNEHTFHIKMIKYYKISCISQTEGHCINSCVAVIRYHVRLLQSHVMQYHRLKMSPSRHWLGLRSQEE